MHRYVLYHRHAASDCAAAFAAWNGFDSPLRGTSTESSCAFGAHEIWWHVAAPNDRDAIAQLPTYVANRTIAVRVAEVAVL